MTDYDLEQALTKINEPIICQGELLEAPAELFDEGYLLSVHDNIKFYIDYEKFARDCELGGDMCEFEYASITYTCTNSNAM